jgi:hypothetical protein
MPHLEIEEAAVLSLPDKRQPKPRPRPRRLPHFNDEGDSGVGSGAGADEIVPELVKGAPLVSDHYLSS